MLVNAYFKFKMINPISLLNANIKTPKIFSKHKKKEKEKEKENQDDDVEVVMKTAPDDTNEVSVRFKLFLSLYFFRMLWN